MKLIGHICTLQKIHSKDINVKLNTNMKLELKLIGHLNICTLQI